MKNLFLILLLLIANSIYSQGEFEAKTNFNKLKIILSEENNCKELLKRLDSLKLTFKDQINNSVNDFLNRDIDFSFSHKRILIYFDFFEYQVDLVIKDESIYLKSLKTEHFKKYTYQSFNEKELLSYLKNRNIFYQSNKNFKDLLKEISINETYGKHCGEALQPLDEAIKMRKMANEKDIIGLKKLIASFNCEKQAFAVFGFSLLTENNGGIPVECQTLVNHIKKRNSEIQICRGCIFGIVDTIY